MSTRKPTLSMRFELALVKGVSAIFCKLSHRKAQSFGGFLGGFFHDFVGVRKGVARQQLARSFPDKDDRWVRKTIREVYRHQGKIMAETSRLPMMKGDVLKRWVVLEGEAAVYEILEEGKGCLVASAHLGCWEYHGPLAVERGMPTSYVVAEQTNWLLGEYVDDIRRSLGVEIILRSDATRGIIKALKGNRLIAMMIDQDARSAGTFVPFFGRLASAFKGVAIFALKMKAPVAVMTSYRDEHGVINCHFRRVDFSPSGNREKDIYELTKLMTTMIEKDIRAYPDQYLWLHKRWKTRPPEDWKPPE